MYATCAENVWPYNEVSICIDWILAIAYVRFKGKLHIYYIILEGSVYSVADASWVFVMGK